jgi:hypothetical protein
LVFYVKLEILTTNHRLKKKFPISKSPSRGKLPAVSLVE